MTRRILLVSLVPDYRSLERAAIPLYVFCCGALLAVHFFAPVINGSQRWLTFAGFRAQPSEITKVIMLLLFARMLQRRAPHRDVVLVDLVVPALVVAVPVVLVLRQPA